MWMPGQAVAAAAEEIEPAHVAKDLKLLANFVADVAVAGVELGEHVFMRVHLSELELGFSE